jgi:hypothetical protein
MTTPIETLRNALKKLIIYTESNECQHDETHRGGVIWTICDGCGRKWSDDRNPFTPYRCPDALAQAIEALATTTQAEPQEPVACERCDNQSFAHPQPASTAGDELPKLPKPFDTGPIPKFSTDQMDTRWQDGWEACRASVAAGEPQEPVGWMHSATGCLYELEEDVPLSDADEWAEPLFRAKHIPTKLWLWKNGDQFLAFAHEYPCFEPGGDPMTLGEPAATAIFKTSFDR